MSNEFKALAISPSWLKFFLSLNFVIVIVVEEKECVTVNISELPTCTENKSELNIGFVLYL